MPFSGRPGFGQTVETLTIEGNEITLSSGKLLRYGTGGLVYEKELLETLEGPWGDVECVSGSVQKVCDPDHDTLDDACAVLDSTLSC
jgi:hypothetical protein